MRLYCCTETYVGSRAVDGVGCAAATDAVLARFQVTAFCRSAHCGGCEEPEDDEEDLQVHIEAFEVQSFVESGVYSFGHAEG